MKTPGWWIIEQNRWTGPLEESDLRRRAEAGDVTGNTLVWGHDITEWTPLGAIPKLESVLQVCASGACAMTQTEPHGIRDVLAMPAATPDQAAWLRLFARGIDFALFGGLFLLFALPSWGGEHSARSLILPFTLTAPLALFIEVFVLTLFGTTPGKALFGITVTDQAGHKPTLFCSILRCAWLWYWGLGFNIPLVNLVGLVYFHDVVTRGQITRWDVQSELRLHQQNISALRGAIGVLLFLLICIAPIGLSKLGQ